MARSWRRSSFPPRGSRMSIIERAAELLRSAPQEQPSRPAAREKGDVRSLDLIERSSAEFAETAYLPINGEPALEPGKMNAPGRSSSAPARRFTVDRDRLRELSLITPDGARTPLAESFRRIKRQVLAKVEKS